MTRSSRVSQRTTRLALLCAGLIGVAVLVTSALAGGTKVAADSTLVVSRSTDPHTLDPGQDFVTQGALEYYYAFYDRLMDLTPSGKLIPALATSWRVSKDGKTYTFQLRKGVTFHSGAPFNAAAVRYNWRRMMALKGQPSQNWLVVKNVKVVSPYVVQIILSKPSTSFLPLLGGAFSSYIGPSEAAVEAHATADDPWAAKYFNEHEDGTGPYTLVSLEHGVQVVDQAYPEYWRGWNGPHATRIVQKIIKEPSTIRLMLERGDLDVAADPLPMSIVQQLRKNPDVTVHADPNVGVELFLMNMSKPPLSDARVRRALSMLFDYDAAIKQVYGGFAQRAYNLLPPLLWPAAQTTSVRYKTDVSAARKLLAAAGYSNGLTVNLEAMDIFQYKDLALLLQSSLAKGGVKVNVTFQAFPVLLQKLIQAPEKRNWDLLTFSLFAPYPDPYSIFSWFTTPLMPVINPGWGNKLTDKWINTANSISSTPMRVGLYRKIIRAESANPPVIVADAANSIVTTRSNVKGWKFVPYYYNLVNYYQLSKS